jgi:hypothetical protein
MKLNCFESSKTCRGSEFVEHRRPVADELVRRVESLEGCVADRQRSLQQDLAEFDSQALAPFAGGERVLQDAHELAAQLALLGEDAGGLIRGGAITFSVGKIDDKV